MSKTDLRKHGYAESFRNRIQCDKLPKRSCFLSARFQAPTPGPPATSANQPRLRVPPHRFKNVAAVHPTQVKLRHSLTTVSVSASRVCVSFGYMVPSGVTTEIVQYTLGVAAEIRHTHTPVPVHSSHYGTNPRRRPWC